MECLFCGTSTYHTPKSQNPYRQELYVKKEVLCDRIVYDGLHASEVPQRGRV